jgi:hypothetical protein
MGEHSEGIAAGSWGGKNNGLGSCQAHHVGIGTQEDRRRSKGAVGEAEGGIGVWEPAAASSRQAFILNSRSIPARSSS